MTTQPTQQPPTEAQPPDFDDGSPYCTCRSIPAVEEIHWNVCAGCGKVLR